MTPTEEQHKILKGLSLRQLEDWVVESLSEQPFRGRQIYRWMYQKCARCFDEMTDIARELRQHLEGKAEIHALALERVIESEDGTRKLLFRRLSGQGRIESVLIPAEDRLTLCVSSQVGCALGCAFCRTGEMGFVDNLTVGEIVDQVVWARRLSSDQRRIGNLVFMGMGEPLNNYDNVMAAIRLMTDDKGLNFSHRKVTLSTAGLVPQLMRLAHDRVQLNLAVSLNATTDELRSLIMPINRRYPLEELLSCLKRFPLPKRSRITIEYVLLADVNDSSEQAHELARLLQPLRCKINLIPFNPYPGSRFQRPAPDRVEAFQKILEGHYFNCRIRDSRGEDRLAACGQLGGEGDAPISHWPVGKGDGR